MDVLGKTQEALENSEDPPPGHYEQCKVVGWDSDKAAFRIRWNDTSVRSRELFVDIPRLYLVFDAEDSKVYAKRVAKAHHSRRMMEATIRYSLYVDSMPTDDKQHLDTEQVNRIIDTIRVQNIPIDRNKDVVDSYSVRISILPEMSRNEITYFESVWLRDKKTIVVSNLGNETKTHI